MFETLETLDQAILLKINSMHSPLLDAFMYYLSEKFATLITVVVIFSVAYAFYKKFSLKKAAEFVLGCAIVFACTDMSSNLFKHSIKRYRPTHNLEIKTQVHTVNEYRGGQYGFFSGHAANTFGIFTFIFCCVNWWQKKYKYLIFLYPLLLVYTRLYLGVHYPSDILVGAIAGIIFGNIVFYVMNTYFFKFNETT